MDPGLSESFQNARLHAKELRGPRSMRTGEMSFVIPRYAPGSAIDTPTSVRNGVDTVYEYTPSNTTHPSGIPLHEGDPLYYTHNTTNQSDAGVNRHAPQVLNTPIDRKFDPAGHTENTNQLTDQHENQHSVEKSVSKSKKWLWIGLGIGVFAIVIIIVVMYVKKKSGKNTQEGSTKPDNVSDVADDDENGNENRNNDKDTNENDINEPVEVTETEKNRHNSNRSGGLTVAENEKRKKRLEQYKAKMFREIQNARNSHSTLINSRTNNTLHATNTPTDPSVLDHTGPVDVSRETQPNPKRQESMHPSKQAQPPKELAQNTNMPPRPPPGSTSIGEPVGNGIQPRHVPLNTAPPTENNIVPTRTPVNGHNMYPTNPYVPPGGNEPNRNIPHAPIPFTPYSGNTSTDNSQENPSVDPFSTSL